LSALHKSRPHFFNIFQKCSNFIVFSAEKAKKDRLRLPWKQRGRTDTIFFRTNYFIKSGENFHWQPCQIFFSKLYLSDKTHRPSLSFFAAFHKKADRPCEETGSAL